MFVLIFITQLIFCAASALTTEIYTGTASDGKANVLYHEKHDVEFSSGRVQSAKTTYTDQNDRTIASMTSNFSESLILPNYEFIDHRNDSAHGIRSDGSRLILWRRSKDNPAEEKHFDVKSLSKDALIVGCQGLHYYLIHHMDEVRLKKKIPIKYMMPGALDYYNFTLYLDKEDEKFVFLQLTIDNFILKIFTSSLNMTYRKSDRRLVKYSGLSNLPDAKGKLQNVNITYHYTEVKE